MGTRAKRSYLTSVEQQSIVVQNKEVPVHIYYENRNNSRVSIGKKGVIIRISRFLKKDKREEHIISFKNWASKKIHHKPTLYFQPSKKYTTGQIITVRGTPYTLILTSHDQKSSRAHLEGTAIFIYLSTYLQAQERQQTIPFLISKILAQKYYNTVYNRMLYLNELFFQKKIKRFTFKYTKSLWGSCSRQGNINLSTRLLLAPASVMDYVIIHELAHLIRQDHSSKFWEIVEAVMPNYKEKSDWLKENGNECDF